MNSKGTKLSGRVIGQTRRVESDNLSKNSYNQSNEIYIIFLNRIDVRPFGSLVILPGPPSYVSSLHLIDQAWKAAWCDRGSLYLLIRVNSVGWWKNHAIVCSFSCPDDWDMWQGVLSSVGVQRSVGDWAAESAWLLAVKKETIRLYLCTQIVYVIRRFSRRRRWKILLVWSFIWAI